jgi:alpha-N-acetylglucosamine transferase
MFNIEISNITQLYLFKQINYDKLILKINQAICKRNVEAILKLIKK